MSVFSATATDQLLELANERVLELDVRIVQHSIEHGPVRGVVKDLPLAAMRTRYRELDASRLADESVKAAHEHRRALIETVRRFGVGRPQELLDPTPLDAHAIVPGGEQLFGSDAERASAAAHEDRDHRQVRCDEDIAVSHEPLEPLPDADAPRTPEDAPDGAALAAGSGKLSCTTASIPSAASQPPA